MKKRFWFAYYWVMIAYLVSILINYFIYYLGIPVPDFFEFIDDALHFNGFYEGINSPPSCNIEGITFCFIKNYYSFLLVFLMTLIRFIAIKKHIWELPDHNDLD